MICANCSAENRAGRRFCLNCGSALGLSCANCGAENEAEARFCGNCGQALGGAAGTVAGPSAQRPTGGAAAQPAGRPAGPAAERRLVTVVFADLVGFTPFAEERDPEEVRSTLERYSTLAREIVARYGGTIEKFIGDAVMAVWGTPIAHEDDAERAVRAALELVDSVGTLAPEIQARAGVLTGEAAVNLGATDQGFLAGDLVNTAARLQSVAPPGAVLVGESTMRAASAAVAFEAAGEQALKGKQAPIPAWQALRVVAQRGGARRSETLETPFVGRDEEFRLLREQLHLTSRDPRPRVVSVTGAGGIGKSRLAWELEKYVDGVVDVIYWHRGRCPAYGEGVSFWALGEMVRSRAGLSEADDETTTRQRITATVHEYVSDDGEREWIEQALLALLGIEQEQPARETLFAAWRRFFENVATRGTTVLVFEDLHWADNGLLDFIDHVLEWSKSVPLLLVTLARPELFDRRPNWGAGRRTFAALALDPLPEPAMREMLAALVPDLPERALATIVERADGIPLYAVETVRTLIADGRLVEHDGVWRPTGELGDLDVPDSLRSLITSRLDALEAADRALLQSASVLGQSFGLPALAAVASDGAADELEQRLRGLVRRELITVESDPRSPERGQYGFMQSLVREVAYSTLARAERRALHLAAARHFEATGGDELAGVLAGHYVAAHEASAIGSEAETVAAQARLALRAAADRAASLGSHRQAAAYVEQALAVTVDRLERARLLERQASEDDLGGRYEKAEAAARAAIELYREAGDTAGLARGRAVLGTVLIHASRITEAVSALEAARADLTDDADPATRADVLAKLARAYYRNLEPQRALEVADEALVLAEHHHLRRTIGEAMVSKATALSFLARHNEALALMRGGMEIARREGDYQTVLRAGANMPGLLFAEGSAKAGVAISRQMSELARTLGDTGQIVWQVGNVAIGAVFAGEDLDAVLAEVDETLAMDLEPSDRANILGKALVAAAAAGRDLSAMHAEIERLVDPEVEPQARIDRMWFGSLVAQMAGDYRTAAELSAAVTEERRDFGAMGTAAVLAAVAGDLGAVRAYLERATEMPISGLPEEAMRLAGRAALLALEGRPDEALPLFRDALRTLRELADVLDEATVALAMVQLLGADNAEARLAGEQALAKLERMRAHALVAQVRRALGETQISEPAASDTHPVAEDRATPALS